MFIHNALVSYEKDGTAIGGLEAVNITAIVADKGKHAYSCANNTDGSNILSVAFSPSEDVVYSAWERNSGGAWRPACCSSYLRLNMSRWW